MNSLISLICVLENLGILHSQRLPVAETMFYNPKLFGGVIRDIFTDLQVSFSQILMYTV